MLYFTKGYDQSLEEALNGAIFDEDHDESMYKCWTLNEQVKHSYINAQQVFLSKMFPKNFNWLFWFNI